MFCVGALDTRGVTSSAGFSSVPGMNGEAKCHVRPQALPHVPPQLSLENTGGMSGVASVVKTRPVMTELIAPLMRFVMVVMSGRPPSIAGPGVARPGDGDV